MSERRAGKPQLDKLQTGKLQPPRPEMNDLRRFWRVFEYHRPPAPVRPRFTT